MSCFARNSFVVTALWAGALSWCRIQLLDCFVEFLIYRLSCRDELMMNQPVNVEERNQQGLDIGLHLPPFFGRGDDDVLHWEGICFVSGSYP